MPETKRGRGIDSYGDSDGDGFVEYRQRATGGLSNQGWSSAAVFLLLQAGLGLHIDAPARKICFKSPRLPESIETLEIRSLKVGSGLVDMVLTRHAQDVAVNVRQGRR